MKQVTINVRKYVEENIKLDLTPEYIQSVNDALHRQYNGAENITITDEDIAELFTLHGNYEGTKFDVTCTYKNNDEYTDLLGDILYDWICEDVDDEGVYETVDEWGLYEKLCHG